MLDRFFLEGLENIDIYYQFSDDYRYYKKGQQEVENFKVLVDFAYGNGMITQETYNEILSRLQRAKAI